MHFQCRAVMVCYQPLMLLEIKLLKLKITISEEERNNFSQLQQSWTITQYTVTYFFCPFTHQARSKCSLKGGSKIKGGAKRKRKRLVINYS